MQESIMRQALRLALESVQSHSGGPFGAVIVRGGEIIGQGVNKVTSTNDPTAHAEVVAIRDACVALNSFRLTGCELYASCEPCPMCLAAAYWARVERVYYAATRTEAAAAGFDDAWLYEEIGRPVEQRRVDMTRVLANEALPPFEAWQKLPDKIRY